MPFTGEDLKEITGKWLGFLAAGQPGEVDVFVPGDHRAVGFSFMDRERDRFSPEGI
jgi:hypothetical protein